MEDKHRSFNRRSFTVLTAAFSGLGLPITGIANHIYQFAPFTPARHAWMTAHNVLALIFITSVSCHIAMNRRALMSYIKRGMSGLTTVSREALAAAAVVSFTLLITVSHVFHTR